MKLQIKWLAIGIVLGCLLPIAAFFGLLFLDGGSQPVFRDQVLPSGKTVKVTSCLLVWGVEHKVRTTSDDCIALEYVSSFDIEDTTARNKETLEVFELIRPTSELWKFNRATIAAFSTVERKGKYDLYIFNRSSGGRWTFDRLRTKVFIND